MPVFNFETIAFLIIGGVIFHVALVMLSRWLNPLFVLAGCYFVLSPISAAVYFPAVTLAKYGRVYVTLLLLFVGFFIQRIYRMRVASFLFLAYVGMYVLAGLWSEAPVAALKYKGLYGLAVIAGFMLAYSVRDFRDLELGVRVLAVATAVFTGFIVWEYIKNPGALVHNQRLALWGMNPNRVGQTLAPMLILIAYQCLYDSSWKWRRFGYILGSIVGVCLLFTGSRGGAGEALLGCFFVAIPLFTRPGQLVAVGTLVAIVVFLAFAFAGIEAPERLLDASTATREGVWSHAVEQWRESPLFGLGWVYNVRGSTFSTANMHSIYFQTLVESGLIGLLILIVAMLWIAHRGLVMYRDAKATGIGLPVAYLAIGYVVAVFMHGVIEAGTTRGSTLNGIMLPFAIGLFDRLPELARGLDPHGYALYEEWDLGVEDLPEGYDYDGAYG